MRLAALAGALAMTIGVAAGCGGGDDGGVSEDEVREVVLNYFNAVEDDQSVKACETYLTQEAVIQVYGQDTCEGVIDFVLGPFQVESVETEEDSATATVLIGREEEVRTVELVKEGDELKIDAIEAPIP